MKTNLRIRFVLTLLAVISGLYSFSQVGINTDGTSADQSALLDVKSTNKGLLVPRMTSAQRAAIISPATGLMVYQTDGINGYYSYNGTNWKRVGTNAHYVGEITNGGIVFWMDPTGGNGLIVSLVDISHDQAWSNITGTLIGPGAESTWNGPANAAAIIGQSGHTSSAAKLCDDYMNANYNSLIYLDWYLPSIDELVTIASVRYILNKNIETVPNTEIIHNEYYWSSTEMNAQNAMFFNFQYTEFNCDGPCTSKGNHMHVRAVRHFYPADY
jgi:hypothetical protein